MHLRLSKQLSLLFFIILSLLTCKSRINLDSKIQSNFFNSCQEKDSKCGIAQIVLDNTTQPKSTTFGTAILISIMEQSNQHNYIFATAFHVLANSYQNFHLKLLQKSWKVDPKSVLLLPKYDLALFSLSTATPLKVRAFPPLPLSQENLDRYYEYFKSPQADPFTRQVYENFILRVSQYLQAPWSYYQTNSRSINYILQDPVVQMVGFPATRKSPTLKIVSTKQNDQTNSSIDYSFMDNNVVGAMHIYKTRSLAHPGMSGGGVFLEKSDQLIGLLLAYDPILKTTYFIHFPYLHLGLNEYIKQKVYVTPGNSSNAHNYRGNNLATYEISRLGQSQPIITWSTGTTFQLKKATPSTTLQSFEISGNEASEIGGNEASEIGGNEASEIGGNEASEIGGNEASEIGGNEASEIGGAVTLYQQLPNSFLEGVFLNRAGRVPVLKKYEGQQILMIDNNLINFNNFNSIVDGLVNHGRGMLALNFDIMDPAKISVFTLKEGLKKKQEILNNLFNNQTYIGQGEYQKDDVNIVQPEITSWGIEVNLQAHTLDLQAWDLKSICSAQGKSIKERFSLKLKNNQLSLISTVSKKEYISTPTSLFKYKFINPKDPKDWLLLNFSNCSQSYRCLDLEFARSFPSSQKQQDHSYTYLNSVSRMGQFGLINKSSMMGRWYGKEGYVNGFVDVFKTQNPLTINFKRIDSPNTEHRVHYQVNWTSIVGDIENSPDQHDYQLTMHSDGEIQLCSTRFPDPLVSKKKPCLFKGKVKGRQNPGYRLTTRGHFLKPHLEYELSTQVRRIHSKDSNRDVKKYIVYNGIGYKMLQTPFLPYEQKEILLSNDLSPQGGCESHSLYLNDSSLIKPGIRILHKENSSLQVYKYNRGLFTATPLTLGVLELWIKEFHPTIKF